MFQIVLGFRKKKNLFFSIFSNFFPSMSRPYLKCFFILKKKKKKIPARCSCRQPCPRCVHIHYVTVLPISTKLIIILLPALLLSTQKMISWVDGENKKKNRNKLMFTFEYHHYFQLRKDDKMIMMRKCWTIIQ